MRERALFAWRATLRVDAEFQFCRATRLTSFLARVVALTAILALCRSRKCKQYFVNGAINRPEFCVPIFGSL